MPYQKELNIPRGCFVSSREYPKPHPHTWLVWPSIFTGCVHQDFKNITPVWRRFIRHLNLNTSRIARPKYRVNPVYMSEKNIFSGHNSFTWNIPTISPEWIAQFPSYEAGITYVKREFEHYLALAEYPFQNYDLYAIYTRIVDFWGHRHIDSGLYADMKGLYDIIFRQANRLSEYEPILLLSDHGNRGGPYHTNTAYLGSNYKIPKSVESILDISKLIIKLMDITEKGMPCLRANDMESHAQLRHA